MTLLGALAACQASASTPIADWELVPAGAGTTGSGGEVEQVHLPVYLDRTAVAQNERFALRADVALPPHLAGSNVRLVIPHLSAPVQLTVDGVALVPASGARPGNYRHEGAWSWSIPPPLTDDGRLGLLLEIESTWEQSQWLSSVPQLAVGDAPWERTVYVFNTIVASVSMAGLFQLGLTCVVVFLLDRRRKAYLWFGIQGMCAIYYNAFVLGVTQELVPPALDVPLLCINLMVAVLVSIYFTFSFFGLGTPSRAWPSLVAVASAIVLASHDAFHSTSRAATVTVVVLAAVILYQQVLIVRVLRRRSDRVSSVLLCCSWMALMLTTWPDMLAWLGWADLFHGARLGTLGTALFALFLSVLLARSHIISLNRSDSLNLALSAQIDEAGVRRREIEQLNDELRRQISDRAAQLFAVVSLAEGAARPAPSLQPGQVIEERYQIVRPLGSGGMGTVYEVRRLRDDVRLALKLALEVHGVAMARMAREAQTASKVTHPNLVRILDVDVARDGFLYLVMELVEGISLADRGEYDDDWAIEVLRQVAVGLAALHEVGIVHRDLKPSNVLLSGSPEAPLVKIVDFGIAREADLPEAKPSMSLLRASTGVQLDSTTEPGRAPSTGNGPALARAADDAALALGDAELPTRTGAWLPPERSQPDETTQETMIPRSSHGAREAEETAAIEPLIERCTPAGGQRRVAVGRTGSSSGRASLLTRTGHIQGTPRYMAPELFAGGGLTSAADIFAFGVMAFELLGRRRPFALAPAHALVARRPIVEARGLAESWSAGSRRIIRMVDLCLSLDPAERPSASELVASFDAAQAGRHEPSEGTGQV